MPIHFASAPVPDTKAAIRQAVSVRVEAHPVTAHHAAVQGFQCAVYDRAFFPDFGVIVISADA
jgi:hypothetical protein